MKILSALLLACCLLASPVLASTFTVDSTADTSDDNAGNNVCHTAGGVCTLRAAIEESNAHAGADTVDFSATGTLTLTSALPTITETLTIDGGVVCDPWAQTGLSWPFVIDANGIANAGLFNSAGALTVIGLEIKNIAGSSSSGYGIRLETSGSTARCNYSHGNWGGIIINGGTGSTIEKNITNDNTLSGVSLNSASGGNTAIDNFTGVNAAGTSAVANQYGVYVENGDGNIVDHNLATGNSGAGIYTKASAATNTVVQNNFIGVDINSANLGCNPLDDQGTGTTKSNNTLCVDTPTPTPAATPTIPPGCCPVVGIPGVTCLDSSLVPIASLQDCKDTLSGNSLDPNAASTFEANGNCSVPGDPSSACDVPGGTSTPSNPTATPTVTPTPLMQCCDCGATEPCTFQPDNSDNWICPPSCTPHPNSVCILHGP